MIPTGSGREKTGGTSAATKMNREHGGSQDFVPYNEGANTTIVTDDLSSNDSAGHGPPTTHVDTGIPIGKTRSTSDSRRNTDKNKETRSSSNAADNNNSDHRGHEHKKLFTLLDLHKASPLEAEAETSIIQSIELKHDPSSKAGSHLFAEIPDHAVDSFRHASATRTAAAAATHPPPPDVQQQHGGRQKKKPQSMESQLVGLTAAMRLMQNRQRRAEAAAAAAATQGPNNKQSPQTTHSGKSRPEEFTLESHVNEGPGNSLMNNANIVYRRKVSNKHKSKSDDGGGLSSEDGVRSSSSQRQGLVGQDTIGIDDSRNEQGDNHVLDVEFGENKAASATADGGRGDQGTESRGCWKFLCCFNLCDRVKEDWTLYSEFLRPQRETIIRRTARVIFFILVPLIAIAFWLFYGLDNPGLGVQGASTSWFLLFLARHSMACYLARATQIFLIDFLSLRTLSITRIFGPFFSLCLVQSRGFPFVISAWALYGFILLSGSNRFARHWLFYQDAIPIFNENNPAGTLTESRMNFLVLTSALVFGIVVTLKRVFVGLHFGKRACRNYGDDLTKVVRDVLLVSQVAGLAMHLERGKYLKRIRDRQAALANLVGDNALDHPGLDVSATIDSATDVRESKVDDGKRRNPYTGSLTDSQRNELMSLLESWEEPETVATVDGRVSMSTVLEFRNALALISGTEFPFSMEFGPAGDREACVESSQRVYDSLLVLQPDDGDILDFDTIALLATEDDGEIDRDKMKELIRLFRPERDGYLSKLDFVRSVDSVYKRLRLLTASIVNSGQIDRAAGNIINWIFYAVYLVIMLSVFGLDPMALFLSLSSIIVAFAFMIGNASARYFEGLLFILARRPYNIGDRIHVSPVDEDTSPNGSNTWFVESVDLFTTTIRYATTNEVATVANGSLATSRVINAARSPKMLCYVYMKFGVDVPYQKVKLFRHTIEQFVKKRPRDWLSLSGFRATRVEVELGYIEYVMVLQHRERWQNIVPMLDAKAEFSSFALEVAKKLDMPYRAPSLPVDLTMANRQGRQGEDAADTSSAEKDLDDIMGTSARSDGSAPDILSDLKAMFAPRSTKSD